VELQGTGPVAAYSSQGVGPRHVLLSAGTCLAVSGCQGCSGFAGLNTVPACVKLHLAAAC
jgi:hypothetical protein